VNFDLFDILNNPHAKASRHIFPLNTLAENIESAATSRF
jgi:hypothetical protein